METLKKIRVSKEEGMNRREHRGFFRAVKLLCMI